MHFAFARPVLLQSAGDFRNPSDRIRFFAQHLYDLQSLRWMPAQVALMMSSLWFGARASLPGMQQFGILLLAGGCTWAWFHWFTEYVRSHYGETEVSDAVKARHRYPPSMKALMIAVMLLLGSLFVIANGHRMDGLAFGSQLCLLYLGRVFDPTNFLRRRVWTGTAIFSMTTICMLGAAGKIHIAANAVMGVALLFIAVADYLLLRHCARYPLEEIAHG